MECFRRMDTVQDRGGGLGLAWLCRGGGAARKLEGDQYRQIDRPPLPSSRSRAHFRPAVSPQPSPRRVDRGGEVRSRGGRAATGSGAHTAREMIMMHGVVVGAGRRKARARR